MFRAFKSKKLATVLATSILMTGIWIKAILEYVLCIWYLAHFSEDQKEVWILIDFNGEVNVMTMAYVVKLGFITWKTDVNI